MMPIDLLPGAYLLILYQNKNTQNSIFIHFNFNNATDCVRNTYVAGVCWHN